MPGVAREKRFPERAWRGATASDIAELHAWMLARHSRRHSDELEQWIAAIAEWRPPPTLSHHKVRWFRSVLLRYGPPGRRWETPETPDSTYRRAVRAVRAVRAARKRRQYERKRSPAPPRETLSHPDSETDTPVPTAPSSRRNGSRSHTRSSSRTAGATPRPVAEPPPSEPTTEAPRETLPTPHHW